jgi:hypothetical protein
MVILQSILSESELMAHLTENHASSLLPVSDTGWEILNGDGNWRGAGQQKMPGDLSEIGINCRVSRAAMQT